MRRSIRGAQILYTTMAQPALTFEQALDKLQDMFGEWSRPALAQMLQANQLNMELTVESILSIGPPPPGFGVSSAGPVDPGVPPQQPRSAGPPRPSPVMTQDGDRRGAKVTLPEDFLRVPGTGELSKSQQIKVDEQLALMLQDELFLRELRGVPEFNPYMQRRSPVPQQGAHGGPSPLSAGSGSGRARTSSGEELAHLRKNLGDMTDTMKRRLGDMYSRFRRNKEGGRDQSHVPLMEDGADDETEVLLFSNSNDAARRRGGGAGNAYPGARGGTQQEFELGAMRNPSRPAPPDYQDEEEILIHTGGFKPDPASKKLV